MKSSVPDCPKSPVAGENRVSRHHARGVLHLVISGADPTCEFRMCRGPDRKDIQQIPFQRLDLYIYDMHISLYISPQLYVCFSTFLLMWMCCARAPTVSPNQVSSTVSAIGPSDSLGAVRPPRGCPRSSANWDTLRSGEARDVGNLDPPFLSIEEVRKK